VIMQSTCPEMKVRSYPAQMCRYRTHQRHALDALHRRCERSAFDRRSRQYRPDNAVNMCATACPRRGWMKRISPMPLRGTWVNEMGIRPMPAGYFVSTTREQP
jgi:hypothetical protein